MFESKLPVHPFTGLTALWVSPSGRAFYPIAGADGTTPGNPVLVRLLEQRAEQEQFIDTLLAGAESQNRDLVDAELSNLTSARERIGQLDAQITPLEEFEATRSAHRSSRPGNGVVPTGSPAPAGEQRGSQSLAVTPRPINYRSAGEFIVDQIRAVGYPGAQVAADPAAQARIAQAMETRALAEQVTGDTLGILPDPIVGAIHNDLDAARPFLQSVGIKPLIGSGKVFHRPVITQHVQTGKQAAELDELASRKFTVGSVDFSKETFGGSLLVSRQEIDWTSPAAWDALLSDLQDVYGVDTEDYYSDAFADGVTQSTTYDDEATGDAKFESLLSALYVAAGKAATANGTKRASSKRLPNHIWLSVDMWEVLGAAIDRKNRLTPATNEQVGSSSITSFSGSILDVPRTVAPGMAAGSLIVGRDSLFEFYEERIGFLQSVAPSVLGVEIAYGGYAAGEFLDDTGFCKIVGDA